MGKDKGKQGGKRASTGQDYITVQTKLYTVEVHLSDNVLNSFHDTKDIKQMPYFKELIFKQSKQTPPEVVLGPMTGHPKICLFGIRIILN